MAVLLQKKINKHILWASVNRPEARNAIDFEVMDELEKLILQIQNDDDIRVLILSGAGEKSFISGGDLKKFHSIKDEKTAAQMSARMHKILSDIEALPCWTIAFVNGDAYGGGIETMLAFDFRLAAAHAKFGFTQGRFNLVPGWGGLTRLVEKVGRSKTLQYLGKAELIDADEALRFGLIEQILYSDDSNEAVLIWTEKLLRNGRDFIKTLKEGVHRISENRRKAMEAEIEPFAKLWAGKEHIKRVDDFFRRDD